MPSSLNNDNEVSHCLCRFWLRLRIFTVHTARHLLAFFLRDKLKKIAVRPTSAAVEGVLLSVKGSLTNEHLPCYFQWMVHCRQWTIHGSDNWVTCHMVLWPEPNFCHCWNPLLLWILKGMGCWWYDIRKYSFCYRVVNVWNSLPDYVVEADSVNSFKNRLDKHWANQEFVFNFNSKLMGTGTSTRGGGPNCELLQE